MCRFVHYIKYGMLFGMCLEFNMINGREWHVELCLLREKLAREFLCYIYNTYAYTYLGACVRASTLKLTRATYIYDSLRIFIILLLLLSLLAFYMYDRNRV